MSGPTLVRRLRRLASLFVAAPAGVAMAAAPVQSEICDENNQTLDRERLALFALSSAGVSHYPYRWVTSHPADYAGLTPAQHLLVAEDFCGDNPKGEDGLPKCAKDDADKLGTAQTIVIDVLSAEKSYRVPDGVTGSASLFSASSAVIACLKKPDGQPREMAPTQIAAPFKQEEIPLRVRGSTDGLQFDRNRDTAFAGVEKASVSFKDDDEAGKDTTKAAIVVGFAVPVVPNVLEVVPYLGFSIDKSKKAGQAREVSDDTNRIGMLVDFRTHGAGVSHLFLLRPELARNRKERSEVLSANFTYMPIVNGWLNDAINITTGDDLSLFSIIPRADLRSTAGDFLNQGSRTVEDSEDFVRIGGQLGVTLTSDIKWLPVEVTVTETYLYGLRGNPDDLSQLRAIFSLYFDANKYLGIDLGYSRGRREDLLKREESWTIGFGAKF